MSNRFIETKCNPDQPALVDYDMAHELVGMISFHRELVGKPPLSAANEVVRFNWRVTYLPNMQRDRTNEHGDQIDSLAARCGFSAETIKAAVSGRLLPERVCANIVITAGGDPAKCIEKMTPSSKALPLNDAICLSNVLPWLAAA